jgi:hypothetical protein
VSTLAHVRRARALAFTALFAFVLVAGVARAATPTKNAIYTWTRTENAGATKWLFKAELHVAPSGKSATGTVYCGADQATLHVFHLKTFPIAANGSFSTQQGVGISTNVWGLTGRFPTAATATAVLHTGDLNLCTSTIANYRIDLVSG